MIAAVTMVVCVGVANHFWSMKLESPCTQITPKLEAITRGRTESSEPKTNGHTILPPREGNELAQLA